MGTLALRHLIMRLRLDGMDDVGELDGVLNEEDWDVVTDKIPVTFLRIELDGEASHVTDGVLEKQYQLLVQCSCPNIYSRRFPESLEQY